VGITAQDFIVKPVRVGLLLDWLGRRLGLDWTHAEASAPAAPLLPSGPAARPPSAPQLQALQELVTLGYLRGIVRRLDQIDSEEPLARDYTARLRTLARQFQLDAMSSMIQQALHDPPTV
jgi:hypothetical protein